MLLLGSVGCARGAAAIRRGRRPEGGMGWAPAGEARVETEADELGFFGSGSGAHVSMGRWSEGSTSRPSCVMIFPFTSLISDLDTVGSWMELDDTLGLRAS